MLTVIHHCEGEIIDDVFSEIFVEIFSGISAFLPSLIASSREKYIPVYRESECTSAVL